MKGDMKMLYGTWFVLVFLSSVSLSSCTSTTYKPGLSLEKSPVKIKAKAQVEPFVDHSPTTDKERKIGGVSATEPKTLAGDLATEVTNAVVNDFLINGVFQEVGKSVENPDIIVKGEIRKFYGKAGINSFGWLTYPANVMAPIWLLGLPVNSSEGAVDIGLTIHRQDGALIGEYNGQAKFSDSYSVYSGETLAVGTRLNKAFNEAIEKIRAQIIVDEEKFRPLASPTIAAAPAKGPSERRKTADGWEYELKSTP
jgi:hypothetical protein